MRRSPLGACFVAAVLVAACIKSNDPSSMSNRKGDSAGASSVAGSASPNTNASNPTTQTTTPGTAAGIRESAKPSGPRRTAEAPGG